MTKYGIMNRTHSPDTLRGRRAGWMPATPREPANARWRLSQRPHTLAEFLAKVATAMTYERIVDYHIALRAGDPPRISSRGKSKCAASLDLAMAQELLVTGHRVPEGADDPRHVYAKHEGVWYQANRHGSKRYHGFPVPDQRVPPAIRERG